MNVPYICQPCRFRIAGKGTRFLLQKQRAFTSFSSPVQPDENQISSSSHQEESQSSDAGKRWRLRSRYGSRLRQRDDEDSATRLEDLFESKQARPQRGPLPPRSVQPDDSQPSNDPRIEDSYSRHEVLTSNHRFPSFRFPKAAPNGPKPLPDSHTQGSEGINLSSKQDRLAFSRNIVKAAQDGSAESAIRLWNRFQERKDQTDSMDVDAIFANFLRAFVTLSRPSYAASVWRAMDSCKIKPTIEHWNPMLEMCRRSKDLSSLVTLWQEMKSTNVLPDNQAWSAYLGGLTQGQQWHQALVAIQDMGRQWDEVAKIGILDAARVPPRHATRYLPSMWPLNTAISELLLLNRSKAADSVAAWAKSRSLSLTVETYNIFLRHNVRKSDGAAIRGHLTDMKNSSCAPDVVTLTTLLGGYLRSDQSDPSGKSPEEQEAAIMRILGDMVGVGIAPNAHTYSTLLNSLLKSPAPNDAACRAVLAHMQQRGIAPFPHLYTILITYYFSRSPPNVAAVDALWRRIRRERTPVDHIVYDRTIDGYAHCGELDKMLDMLRRMPAAGRVPGWIAIAKALDALTRAEEWDLCAELVEDVERDGGLLRLGKRGQRGEEEFWDLVRELRDRRCIPLREMTSNSKLPDAASTPGG